MMLLGFIGTTEVIIILIIALLVFGPQKLPEVGRQIGSLYQELNRMRGDVQKALDFDQFTRFDQPNHNAYNGDSYSYDTPKDDLHATAPALLEGTPDADGHAAHTSAIYADAGEGAVAPHTTVAPPGPRGTVASAAPFAAAARETFNSEPPLTPGMDKDA